MRAADEAAAAQRDARLDAAPDAPRDAPRDARSKNANVPHAPKTTNAKSQARRNSVNALLLHPLTTETHATAVARVRIAGALTAPTSERKRLFAKFKKKKKGPQVNLSVYFTSSTHAASNRAR